MLKLFVNCDTCQVFDDPNKREFSHAYKCGSEFIWTGPLIVSPNGHFMFVNGCIWSFPNEWRLYDIRNMTTNSTISCDHLPISDPYDSDFEGRLMRQISLYDCLTIKTFDKDDERHEYEDFWLGDDEMFTFEFVTDDEITVKYYHNKEWKYFNTICLVQHCGGSSLDNARRALSADEPTKSIDDCRSSTDFGVKSVDDLQSSMDLVANLSGSESFLDSLSRIP